MHVQSPQLCDTSAQPKIESRKRTSPTVGLEEAVGSGTAVGSVMVSEACDVPRTGSVAWIEELGGAPQIARRERTPNVTPQWRIGPSVPANRPYRYGSSLRRDSQRIGDSGGSSGPVFQRSAPPSRCQWRPSVVR